MGRLTQLSSVKFGSAVRLFLWCCLVIWVVGGIQLLYGNSFDVFFQIHTHHSPPADFIFKWFTHLGDVILVGPILLLVWWFSSRTAAQFGLMAFTQLLPVLIIQSIKYWINAPRPMAVYGKEAWFHHIEGVHLHQQLSFPSGHTAGAFACFTLLTLLLGAQNRLWGLVCFLISSLVAYSRMYLGQHFYEDVYVGSLIGTLGTVILYWCYKTWITRKK